MNRKPKIRQKTTKSKKTFTFELVSKTYQNTKNEKQHKTVGPKKKVETAEKYSPRWGEERGGRRGGLAVFLGFFGERVKGCVFWGGRFWVPFSGSPVFLGRRGGGRRGMRFLFLEREEEGSVFSHKKEEGRGGVLGFSSWEEVFFFFFF